jgi:hypothetical protein
MTSASPIARALVLAAADVAIPRSPVFTRRRDTVVACVALLGASARDA